MFIFPYNIVNISLKHKDINFFHKKITCTKRAVLEALITIHEISFHLIFITCALTKITQKCLQMP